MLIVVPEGLLPADQYALVTAAEWLAQYGHFTVWLAGAALHAVDRLRSVAITLPGYVTDLVAEVGQADTGDASPAGTGDASPAGAAVLRYPPLSGAPRPDSAAEQALERALAPHEWAKGRRWNHTFEWNLLAKAYRLDLFWPADGVVVEVDGAEHRGRWKFADDRRRDAALQLLGHDVLRFPNEEVLSDVHAIVRTIEQLLSKRRAAHLAPHGEAP